MEISIDYAGIDDVGIIVPGVTPSATSRRAMARASGGGEEDGVVITPDPSGIVIKTRLTRKGRDGRSTFFVNDDSSHDAYVPPSLSGICNIGSPMDGGEDGDDGTKVFVNICTHPLIASPGQRKGLDERTGEEIDGWRLPMSMGELRPCYDKMANAAIAADCILNPAVVRELISDPNHLHFVCDLVVQCASRKFGHAWFGGRDLDRRFKLPKMKYAGYVDETSGLPIIHETAQSSHDGMGAQKAAVAKQRVKGHGGKSAIIEELDSGPSRLGIENSLAVTKISSQIESTHVRENIRIELFIGGGCKDCMPLFGFLRLVADQDGIVPPGQPSLTLREIIKSPELKPCDDRDNVHKSQLLKAPIPYDVTTFVRDVSGLDSVKDRSWIIIAKATASTSTNVATTPMVDLSPFLLSVSTRNAKTECILPFPVDTRQAAITYNNRSGDLEIRMPLLQSTLNLEDPGTRQFEIQNAIGGHRSGGTIDGRMYSVMDLERSEHDCTSHGNATKEVMFSSYFLEANMDDEDIDTQQLPEDAFHSQDILSRHLLQQQNDERVMPRNAKNDHGRREADTEYINVDDFRLVRSNKGAAKTISSSSDLVMGLV